MDISIVTITTIIGIIALSAALEGYFKTKLNIIFRILLAAGALLMIIPETYTDITGVVIVGILFGLDWLKSRKLEQAKVEYS